ncbi:MAG TPA: DUF1569 domain-containing protein [Thermoanaerobaculia bacterium]|jgi:hypothetical protein
MKTLFDATDRESLVARIKALDPAAARQWGKMDPAQMLCHCGRALETATGDRPMKQKFIGKILAPLVRKSVLGEKPFGKNSPTDPTFVVADTRDFAAEKARLLALIDRFAQRGTAEVGKETHAFFGKLSGDQWGELMYKHIDHHLRQFGG